MILGFFRRFHWSRLWFVRDWLPTEGRRLEAPGKAPGNSKGRSWWQSWVSTLLSNWAVAIQFEHHEVHEATGFQALCVEAKQQDQQVNSSESWTALCKVVHGSGLQGSWVPYRWISNQQIPELGSKPRIKLLLFATRGLSGLAFERISAFSQNFSLLGKSSWWNDCQLTGNLNSHQESFFLHDLWKLHVAFMRCGG